MLDFDATDNPLHGQQEGRFFHGYYDSYCYLPLYVFAASNCCARSCAPSRIDAAKHAGAILKLLVRRLRQAWPDVRIVFRADSGFCRPRIINWCERDDVRLHHRAGAQRAAEEMVEYGAAGAGRPVQHSGTKQRSVTKSSTPRGPGRTSGA